MPMMQTESHSTPRPRLLFVDDEQRVLNSMRIMFRRQFDLFLASHGSQALDIVKQEDIDVIVADHRMPQMTGVEVLTQVRRLSPRTVRILLTGYADLDAVEGSINEGEVFRFLTKPCAPQQLRDTVELAAKLARTAPAPAAQDVEDDEGVEIILESESVTEIDHGAPLSYAHAGGTAEGAAAAGIGTAAERGAATEGGAPAEALAPATRGAAAVMTGTAESDDDAADIKFTSTTVIERPSLAAPIALGAEPAGAAADAAAPRVKNGLGVIVFTTDEEMLEAVQKAVRGRLPVYAAGNIVKVVKILTEERPGVLITDVSNDKATIQAMTARLKQHLPQLVTIAVSPHRDVLDMVWLINHGQIFRFLRKPLSPGRCAISLQAALQHHRMLLKNPELCRRHEVETAHDNGLVDGLLSKLKGMKRLWAQA
jgi:DNA-binding NtrC family response regulator